MEQQCEAHPRTPRRWVSRAALLIAVAATIAVIGGSSELTGGWHITFVALAAVAYLAMFTADQRWGGLTIGLVASGGIATALVALSGPAHFTGDLWSYAMYGRIVAAHHASPYVHLPASYPADPFLHRVGRSWRHTLSVYGPAFTAFSAFAALFLGAAAQATRVFYQLVAIVALGGAAAIVWRRTRSPGAVAFLTVHPMIAMFIVSGARNDILVGLALLGAVVLMEQGHTATGGFVAGLGALVKLTGAVGLVALVVTAYARGDRRAAARLGLGGGGVIAFGYLLAGPAALFTPMKTAGALFSRGTPWQVASFLGLMLPSAHVALVVLAVLVVIVLARHAHGPARDAVAGTLTMLALGASWALPGYMAWGLPTAALDHRSRMAKISAAGGLVLLMTFEVLRHPIGEPDLVHAALIVGPLAMVALIIGLLTTRAPISTRSKTMNELALDLHATSSPFAGARTLVVIPTLNEAPNIETVLRRVRRAAPLAHVLVVDDGSTDGTPELVERSAAKLGQIRVARRTGPRGLGPAYRFGFERGLREGFDTLVEMDADLSHDPRDLPVIIQAINDGAELAIGSRYVDGGIMVGWPKRREALSRAGGWYARHLLHSPVRDMTSGYRAYRADLLRAMDLETVRSTGYGFQIEMTHRARQAGATITEVPIVFRERAAGASKMSAAIAGEAVVMVARTAMHDLRRRDAKVASRPVDVGKMSAAR
jgi:dolichol-phosphate mannosyltransferase